MIIKTIQYSESYEFSEYGLKRWRKFGLEGELGENEDVMNAHTQLKNIVDAMKAASIAELEEMRGTKTIVVDEKLPPQTAFQKMEDAINQCSTPEVLQSFQLIVNNNPELQSTYDNKLKSLTDGL